jgi:hypothetical protein
LIDPALQDVGADESLGFNRLEQFVCFLLGLQQSSGTVGFHFFHGAGLT